VFGSAPGLVTRVEETSPENEIDTSPENLFDTSPGIPFAGSRHIMTERAVSIALEPRSLDRQEPIVAAFGYFGMTPRFCPYAMQNHPWPFDRRET
jgi:hypothetical protein